MTERNEKAAYEIDSAITLLSCLHSVGMKLRESCDALVDFHNISSEIIALVGRRLDSVSESLGSGRNGAFDDEGFHD